MVLDYRRGLKCHHKYLMREIEGDNTEEDCHVNTEAETGVIWPYGKDY